MESDKIEALAESAGLDEKDLIRIKIAKKRETLSKANPVYWLAQLVILSVSLIYSFNIRTLKLESAYPFESILATIFLSPIPVSVHLVNLIYSFVGEKRSNLSQLDRQIVFVSNLILSACAFLIIYLATPFINRPGVMYNVFDPTGSRREKYTAS